MYNSSLFILWKFLLNDAFKIDVLINSRIPCVYLPYFPNQILTRRIIEFHFPNYLILFINCNHYYYDFLQKKMFCLQLILLLCKLQYMLLNSQLNGIHLGGSYPMNHTIYKQSKPSI